MKKGNRWYIIYTIPVVNGRRKQKWESGFNTKREAELALAKRIVEVGTNSYVEPSNQTLADFIVSWSADKKVQVRPSTWRSYDWHIRHHILPHLGGYRLSDLRPPTIQQFYSELRKKPRADGNNGTISERSILHVHLVLHSMLQRAVKWGYLAVNPCDLVDKPKPSEPELNIWTLDEVRLFLSHAKDAPLYIVFLLLFTTGMRIGEVLGLRWSDVDIANQTISVRQQVTTVKGGYHIGPPKTRAGRRTIDVNKEVMTELSLQRKRVESFQEIMDDKFRRDLDLVCCTSLGTPLYRSNVTKHYNEIIEKAGLKRIRIHDARHTHASLLLEQGESLKMIQERIGHEKADVLLNRYAHVLPRTQRKAVDTFGSHLFNNPVDNDSDYAERDGESPTTLH